MLDALFEIRGAFLIGYRNLEIGETKEASRY